jgi:hypothetical protein
VEEQVSLLIYGSNMSWLILVVGHHIEMMDKYYPIASFYAVYVVDLYERLDVARRRFEVVKSAPRYTESALDEIKLLQHLITSSTTPIAPSNPNPSPSPFHHVGRFHVVSFLDHFRHQGPNGIHVSMMFKVLGENLLGTLNAIRISPKPFRGPHPCPSILPGYHSKRARNPQNHIGMLPPIEP